MKNKRGFIRVSDVIMWDYEVMTKVYSVFYPFHIEYKHWMNYFEIYGVCDDFDEIKEGDVVKQYEFTLTRKEDDSLDIKCSKV